MEIMGNLRSFVSAVRRNRHLDSMATGIWISNRAALELLDPELRQKFKAVLLEENLWPTSINGFPFGGFHEQRVKENVYLPDWSSSARLDYTCLLAELASVLLLDAPDPFRKCAISTVPLGFKDSWTEQKEIQAIKNLHVAEEYFRKVSGESDVNISLCLEMEPGCVLESTPEVIDFWKRLYAGSEVAAGSKQPETNQEFPAAAPQALGLCYDICHQAVMFESIFDSLQSLAQAGIPVFKFQISSAIEVRWPSVLSDSPDIPDLDSGQSPDPLAPDVREAADIVQRLRPFCDQRYLHQTSVLGDELHRYLDLDIALKRADAPGRGPAKGPGPQENAASRSHLAHAETSNAQAPDSLSLEHLSSDNFKGKARNLWRIHYHVPIHLESLDDGLEDDEAGEPSRSIDPESERPKETQFIGRADEKKEGGSHPSDSIRNTGLFTTKNQIEQTLDYLAAFGGRQKFAPVLEVETYTWTILPESLRDRYTDVVESIQKELDYLEQCLQKRNLLG